MRENENNQLDEERMDKEAAEWLVKRDRGFTPEEQDTFFLWLGENPKHGDYFAGQRQTWQEFDLLAQWLPEHSEEPNADLLAHGMPRRHWGHWRAVSAMAASLAAIFFIWAVWLNGNVDDQIKPQHIVAGDYGYHVLADGSELDMNRGSEVLVEYSEDTRLVKLLTGEVHFTVAKNPNRPFVVRARGADVCAVGTAFNVLLDSHKVEVLVTEGKVRMQASEMEGSLSSLNDGELPEALDLVIGQRSVYLLEAETPTFDLDVVQAEVIDEILSWKHETLEFEETPLEDAILEFNRRNDVQLVIADGELESETVGGTFRSNNLDGFTNLLERVFDVKVEQTNETEIILRKI